MLLVPVARIQCLQQQTRAMDGYLYFVYQQRELILGHVAAPMALQQVSAQKQLTRPCSTSSGLVAFLVFIEARTHYRTKYY